MILSTKKEVMNLSDLEKKYDIIYPELYRQLESDGMLVYETTTFSKLKANPPLLLYTFDFELMNKDEISEEIEWLRDPESYLQLKEEFKFIPFAKSGAGDHYSFLFSEQDGSDVPIVFMWHDANEVNYLAKNLQDFIFRTILTDMSQLDAYNKQTDEDFRINLSSCLNKHRKYLTNEQNEILNRIFEREIRDYTIDYGQRTEVLRGLLTDVETKEILTEIIPFKNLFNSFEYSNE
jgi:hypothetical protein